MIKVALLSRWHVHADDYAGQIQKNKDLSIQLVWDEDPKRGKKWADELGVPFEQDLQAVLSNPEVDGVVVNTPTNLHKEIIIDAAKHKKHIFTEKVLAFTVKDGEEIYAAVEEHGVELMVSLPRLTEDYYLYAQKAVDSGWLGQLTMIRCRFAHNGAVAGEGQTTGWLPARFFDQEQAGGGALIDLGAHPIYLTNRLAGPATAVYARLQATKGLEVDDNAAVIVEYESGSLGILETSFLSNGSPFQLELYGTEGTLLIEDENIRIKSSQLADGEWFRQTNVQPSIKMPIDQWSEAIKDGKKPAITKDDVLNLTCINEAAALSQIENRRIAINEILGE